MKRFHLLAPVLVLAMTAIASSGCVVDDSECNGPNCELIDPYVADLEVYWTIEGGTNYALCDDFGIDHWIITASGPEERQVAVDCYDDPWDSGTSFYALSEGLYSVDVAAIDYDGYDVGGSTAQIDLVDEGFVEELEFTLYDNDFSY